MAKNGFKVMDSDLHIVEPWDLWIKYTEPEFKERAPVGARDFPLDFGTEIDGREMVKGTPGLMAISGFRSKARVETQKGAYWEGRLKFTREREVLLKEPLERGFDPVSQLDAMDREGIDIAVLFPTRGTTVEALEYRDTKLAAAVARAYNNWLADFIKAAPARLYGTALISVHDVTEAVVEVRRAREELGFKGVFIRPNPVRGRNWHLPVYYPLWEECQRQGLTVIFHESQPCLLPQACAERFNNEPENIWTMGHVINHPAEQMYASLCMIAGGVLERFPQLRVGFLEANCSWLPHWLWRMDEHQEKPNAINRLPKKPSEYFLRQCFVSVEPEEELAKYYIDYFGDGNLVFSTDYPHFDSAYPHAVDNFLNLPITQENKRKILWDNCHRLYGM